MSGNIQELKVTVINLEIAYPLDVWKIKKPSSSIVWFWLVFILMLPLSFLYALGIWKLGDAVFVRPANPTRFSFNYAIILIAGLVIYISFFMHVWQQRENYKKYVQIIFRFQNLIQQVPKEDTTFRLILVSNLLLMWELTKYGYIDEAGRSIITNLPQTYIKMFKERRARFGNRYAALITMDMLNTNIEEKYKNSENTFNFIATASQITTLKEDMTALILACETNISFFSLAMAQKIFSVLYLIFVPMLQWLSDGENILYTYPIIFLVIGSMIVFRFHVDDIFYKPISMYTGPINVALQNLFIDSNNTAFAEGLFKSNTITYRLLYTKHSQIPI